MVRNRNRLSSRRTSWFWDQGLHLSKNVSSLVLGHAWSPPRFSAVVAVARKTIAQIHFMLVALLSGPTDPFTIIYIYVWSTRKPTWNNLWKPSGNHRWSRIWQLKLKIWIFSAIPLQELYFSFLLIFVYCSVCCYYYTWPYIAFNYVFKLTFLNSLKIRQPYKLNESSSSSCLLT